MLHLIRPRMYYSRILLSQYVYLYVWHTHLHSHLLATVTSTLICSRQSPPLSFARDSHLGNRLHFIKQVSPARTYYKTASRSVPRIDTCWLCLPRSHWPSVPIWFIFTSHWSITCCFISHLSDWLVLLHFPFIWFSGAVFAVERDVGAVTEAVRAQTYAAAGLPPFWGGTRAQGATICVVRTVSRCACQHPSVRSRHWTYSRWLWLIGLRVLIEVLYSALK